MMGIRLEAVDMMDNANSNLVDRSELNLGRLCRAVRALSGNGADLALESGA